MEKPFQKDIDFLKEELAHHEYIAKKSAQEHNDIYAKDFEKMCGEIRTAIEVVERRQTAALSEWAAMEPSRRKDILCPLNAAVEHAADTIKRSGCPEFAIYFQKFLGSFFTDLYHFRK